jgi:hypothetical protein
MREVEGPKAEERPESQAKGHEDSKRLRPGRCAIHPGVARVGTCQLCGRGLCLACAVLVRGSLVGPECMDKVVPDAPAARLDEAPIPMGGDRLALMGFALLLVLSVFPWTRFGDSSGFLGAWSAHWSLVAVLSAAGGLAVVAFSRRLGPHPVVQACAYLTLGSVAGVATVLHRIHPPPLSAATSVTLLAMLGAALAALGGLVKGAAVIAAHRPPP